MSTPLESARPDAGLPHRLLLPGGETAAQAAMSAMLADATLQGSLPPAGPLQLVAGERLLRVAELRQLAETLAEAGFDLVSVASSNPRTRVAAAALGLGWEAQSPPPGHKDHARDRRLTIHEGTLRAGDQLEVGGSLLVLGDVNPGARISAAGHVLVWGQLRGVAHAGSRGDRSARIVALQLRPLQLRIAEIVARGPTEPPPAGLVEQARLEDGTIRIEVAPAGWPVSAESGSHEGLPA
jgi:septum site-determining protein MinC